MLQGSVDTTCCMEVLTVDTTWKILRTDGERKLRVKVNLHDDKMERELLVYDDDNNESIEGSNLKNGSACN